MSIVANTGFAQVYDVDNTNTNVTFSSLEACGVAKNCRIRFVTRTLNERVLSSVEFLRHPITGVSAQLDGITDVSVCCDIAETPAPLMVVLIDYAGNVIGTAPFTLQYLSEVGIPFDIPLTGSAVRVRFVVTKSNEHVRKMFGLISPLHRSTCADGSRPVSLIEKETLSSNDKVPNKRVHSLYIRFASMFPHSVYDWVVNSKLQRNHLST